MARLLDHLEKLLWDEVVGRNETHPRNFTLQDAQRFFLETAAKYPQAKGCVLSVEPKGDRFQIIQLLIDGKGEILSVDKERYVGRKIVADDIDDSVVNYLNGETRRTMYLPE